MRAFGSVVIAIGLTLHLGPLSVLIVVLAYAFIGHPTDQSYWGTLGGGLLILTVVAAPLGLLVFVFGLAIRGTKARKKTDAQ
jgi:hypothetical protein